MIGLNFMREQDKEFMIGSFGYLLHFLVLLGALSGHYPVVHHGLAHGWINGLDKVCIKVTTDEIHVHLAPPALTAL
jgi:hypothetical protein